jgi:hypothetical protein
VTATGHGRDPEPKEEPKQPDVPQPAKEAPVCLLAVGDKADVTVDEIAAKTGAGNVVLVGTASCRRLKPEPAEVIIKGTFNSTSKIDVIAPPPPPGWGGGLYLGINQGGAIIGPAIAAPPLKLASWQFDATAGAGVNLSGAWGVGISLIVR